MERAFTEPFTIGRGMRATLHVDSGRVSRLHAEVVIEEGNWLLRDAGSTNGTYHKGQRVEHVPLVNGETAVRLGREGPFVYLSVSALGEGGGSSAVRVSGATSPEENRPRFSEEDTQRQSQPYRSRPTEEPTAWHTVPTDRQTGATATASSGAASQAHRGEPDQGKPGATRSYVKIIAAVAVLLLALALALLIL